MNSPGRGLQRGRVFSRSRGIHAPLPTHAFLPLAILCVLAGIGSLVARFRASTNYALKQQLKWVALGLMAGVGLILCARAGSAASPLHGQIMPILWEAMFQLGIIIVALGFLVSLLRFRLFDAETVISRSAAYAGLTIALVAKFGGTEALIQNLGQSYLGMNIGGISGRHGRGGCGGTAQPASRADHRLGRTAFPARPDLAEAPNAGTARSPRGNRVHPHAKRDRPAAFQHGGSRDALGTHCRKSGHGRLRNEHRRGSPLVAQRDGRSQRPAVSSPPPIGRRAVRLRDLAAARAATRWDALRP